MNFIYLIMSTVLLYLSAVSLMIIVRVLYPLFASEEGAAFSFIYATTEPIIMPVRAALDRSEVFSAIPMDFSSIFAFIILFFIKGLLTLFVS
ncbi:MAG: YggT family protein [Eubacteriales bacterium]|nr:YggT family protein [Eubacteriales bacterium]